MSDTVIRVENLGKKYIIGHQTQERYTALRDVIANGAKGLFKSFRNPKFKPVNYQEEFWALKDVSFEIKQGDRVGIIGRNGAGKSTLLKILSRITEPTQGSIKIKGRVASLLEVGTGFHPELTGRENIYLNGAILGMSRIDIKRKFDEIVAFAEVEKFLDTPVKRYSSGMYVRLAFAVAAHLEPEILIVDEVLAVGDAQFQKKCLGKMEDVSNEGRTVIFVSHQMSAIQSLCTRGILLKSGNLYLDSSSQEAINVYLEQAYTLADDIPLAERKDRGGSGKVRAYSIQILNIEGNEVSSLQSGKDYSFKVGYFNQTNEYLNDVVVSLDIFDDKSNRVLLFRTNFTNSNLNLDNKSGYILCNIENLPLAKGSYRLAIFFSHADAETLDYIEDAVNITVDGGDFFGTGSEGLPSHCKILATTKWSKI
ncbi:ABC transporter ATP-binding protein [Nostoc parmelioides]|uniref:ABC transporter ATP-binding protein n=1 Tax=Nostoc parmelioides FACHB-3921 TaxID=2692909 RepID=A0ABR8BLP1_9NOSO|nr:ABC transporter ATP-binding protein [Nostoc parmelioides]MBD2254574.1 ABC transporter ATP-binding protein [Nostoc parmelioides FACHB-3921]